jgi:hypothetical protein
MENLETEIAEWRSYVGRSSAVDGRDIDELEDHLRGQIDDLVGAGLASDEAFLVAVKRIGSLDEVSGEYAREHSGRLWRQLVGADTAGDEASDRSWKEALAFAVAAAVAVQIARLAAGILGDETWLARNLGLLVLPFLAGYFVRRRRLSLRRALLTVVPFAAAALVINLYPYDAGSAPSCWWRRICRWCCGS